MATSPTTTPTNANMPPPSVDFRSDEDIDRDWKPSGRRPQSYVFHPSPPPPRLVTNTSSK